MSVILANTILAKQNPMFAKRLKDASVLQNQLSIQPNQAIWKNQFDF